MKREVMPDRIFLTYLLLTFYCFGAVMTHEFVVFRSWADAGNYISAAGFARWHAALSRNIAFTLVAPMLALTPVILLLLWVRPMVIPKWPVVAALSGHAIAWLCTTIIQLPVELRFDHGEFSASLMSYLKHTGWIRITAFTAEISMAVYMATLYFTPPCSSDNKQPVEPEIIVPFSFVKGNHTHDDHEALVK